MNSKKNKKLLYLLAFFIPATTALLGLILGGFAPFGTKNVFSAGGFSKNLTYLIELGDRLKNGESIIYSNRFGTGYSLISAIAYYAADPLNLIACIFPKHSMPAVLDLIYIIKIGAAGLFFAIFLNYKKTLLCITKATREEENSVKITAYKEKLALKKAKKEEKAAASGKKHSDFKIGHDKEAVSKLGIFLHSFDFVTLALSISYALSSYMIGQGLNTAYLSSVALFPLLLMGIEKIVSEERFGLYLTAMALSFYGSFQLGIVSFIISILYLLTRDYKDHINFAKSFIYKLIADILAVLLSLPVLVPVFNYHVFREEYSINVPYFTILTNPLNVLRSLISGVMPSSLSYFSIGLDTFAGAGVLLFLFIFILNPNISLVRKLKAVLIPVLLLSASFLSSFNYIFNGFYYSETYVSRYSYAIVAMLLLIVYEAFINLEHTRVWQVNVSILFSLAFIVLIFLFSSYYESNSIFFTSVEFLAIAYFVLIIYKGDSMAHYLYPVLASILIIAEMICITPFTLAKLGKKSKALMFSTDYMYYMAEQHIHETDPSARIMVFDVDDPHYDPVTAAINSYDYIITTSNKAILESEYVSKTDSYFGVDIYKNSAILNGYAYTKYDMNQFKINDSNFFESLNVLTNSYLGAGDVYSSVTGEFLSSQQVVYTLEGAVDPYRSLNIFKFTSDTAGPLFSCINGKIQYYGNKEAGRPSAFYLYSPIYIFKNKTASANYAVLDPDAFNNLLNVPHASYADSAELSEYTQSSDLSLIIDAPENGYVILPLDDTKYLTFKSNGEIVYTENKGQYTLIPVKAGANIITVSKNITPVMQSYLIALLVLLIIILIKLKVSFKFNTNKLSSNRFYYFIHDNRIYFYCSLISLTILTILLIITRSMPFGPNGIIGGDAYYQGYSAYLNNVDQVRHGSASIFSLKTCMFMDDYSTFIFKLLSPVGMLYYKYMPDFLIYPNYILGFVVSYITGGLSMIFYLTHRLKGYRFEKHDSRLLGYGLAFTICNYGMSYFLYSNFGFLRYLPLIILAFEYLIYEKKAAFYIVMLYIFMGDAYYAFMMCIFLLLYFFTLEFKSFKDFFFKGVRFGLASIAAAGLAAFKLIPYFMRTKDSLYIASDSESIKVNTFSTPDILNTIKQYILFDEGNVVTSVFYKTNIYFGIFFLVALPIYFINKNIALGTRIKRGILIILYYLAFNVFYLNYVFHGFHVQSLVPNRYIPMFVFLVIICVADGLADLDKLSIKRLSLSTIIFSLFISGIWIYAAFEKHSFGVGLILSLLFVIVYNIILNLYKNKKSTGVILSILLVIELIINAIPCFITKISSTALTESAQLASIKELRNNHSDLYAADVNCQYIGTEHNNFSYPSGVNSVSGFASTMTNANGEQFGKWNLLFSTNCVFYTQGNLLSDMMLHLKYHFVDTSNDYSGTLYPVIDRNGTIEMSENYTYLPLGIYFKNNEALDRWDTLEDKYYDSLFDYQNDFSNSLGLGNIYNEYVIEKADENTDENSTYFYIANPEKVQKNMYGLYPYPVVLNLGPEISGDIYIAYGQAILYIGTKEAGTSDYFELSLPNKDEIKSIKIATSNKYELMKLHDNLAQYVSHDTYTNWNSINTSITAPDEGTIYLSIPNYRGFTVYLDGNKINQKTFLGGIGINVSKGEHTIKIKYTVPGMYLGIATTLLIILLIIIYFAILRKKLLPILLNLENEDAQKKNEEMIESES